MRGKRSINFTLILTYQRVLPTRRSHGCRSANFGQIPLSEGLLRLLLGNVINYGGSISKLSINDQMLISLNNRGTYLRNIIPNSKNLMLSNALKCWCQPLLNFNGQIFQQQKNSISCRSSRWQGMLDSSPKACHLPNSDIKGAIEKKHEQGLHDAIDN